MSKSWEIAEHDMFHKAHAGTPWMAAMSNFLYTSNDGWMGRLPGTKLFLPDEERPAQGNNYEARRCHCYYYGAGTAGVVEFEQIFDDNVGWRRNAFKWRVVNERNGPSSDYRGLFIHVLHDLDTPAPNNEAARWRWLNWHARGLQMPIYRGMGGFYYNGRDRTPVVVARDPVSRLKGIEVVYVSYKVVSGSEQTGDAKYEFDTEISTRKTWYILPSNRKGEKGKHLWRFQGGFGTYTVGFFDAYRDPHF